MVAPGAPPAIDARTAAYGSAYCIVRLTRGLSSYGLEAANPDGAGSEKAPYASMLGRLAGCELAKAGADGDWYERLLLDVLVGTPESRFASLKGE